MSSFDADAPDSGVGLDSLEDDALFAAVMGEESSQVGECLKPFDIVIVNICVFASFL